MCSHHTRCAARSSESKSQPPLSSTSFSSSLHLCHGSRTTTYTQLISDWHPISLFLLSISLFLFLYVVSIPSNGTCHLTAFYSSSFSHTHSLDTHSRRTLDKFLFPIQMEWKCIPAAQLLVILLFGFSMHPLSDSLTVIHICLSMAIKCTFPSPLFTLFFSISANPPPVSMIDRSINSSHTLFSCC